MTPILAAELHTNDPDIRTHVYSAAYGLEMQIDNDWNAEVVALVPRDLLPMVVEETGLTGDDVRIASAGTILTSNQELPDAVNPKHKWALVDVEQLGSAKANLLIAAAVYNGNSLIVSLGELDFPDLELPSETDNGSEMVIAAKSGTAARMALKCAAECSPPIRVLLIPENIADAMNVDLSAFSGLLLRQNYYEGFPDVLNILENWNTSNG